MSIEIRKQTRGHEQGCTHKEGMEKKKEQTDKMKVKVSTKCFVFVNAPFWKTQPLNQTSLSVNTGQRGAAFAAKSSNQWRKQAGSCVSLWAKRACGAFVPPKMTQADTCVWKMWAAGTLLHIHQQTNKVQLDTRGILTCLLLETNSCGVL